MDPLTGYCPHARPIGDFCPHRRGVAFSPVEEARLDVESTERAEADAREQHRLAEGACVASGRQHTGIDWLTKARLEHAAARRAAFEAREALHCAELAAAEEERRRR